jgi:hypothetical protein
MNSGNFPLNLCAVKWGTRSFFRAVLIFLLVLDMGVVKSESRKINGNCCANVEARTDQFFN